MKWRANACACPTTAPQIKLRSTLDNLESKSETQLPLSYHFSGLEQKNLQKLYKNPMSFEKIVFATARNGLPRPPTRFLCEEKYLASDFYHRFCSSSRIYALTGYKNVVTGFLQIFVKFQKCSKSFPPGLWCIAMLPTPHPDLKTTTSRQVWLFSTLFIHRFL